MTIVRKSTQASLHKLLLAVGFCAIGLSVSAQTYEKLEWVALLPPEDYEALMSAPPLTHDGGDFGGPQTSLDASSYLETNSGLGSRFEEALLSTAVREELDGKEVELPGFVVPLTYDANEAVTEFFLVPYFGACIHVPPPPPNQIIFVSYPEGLPLASIFEPYTVQGKLSTSITSNDTALSAYRLDAAAVELYQAR